MYYKKSSTGTLFIDLSCAEDRPVVDLFEYSIGDRVL